MEDRLICCVKCEVDLDPQAIDSHEFRICPACGVKARTILFPAFYRAVPDVTPGARVEDPEEAVCFHHPRRKATHVCDDCGVFVCETCAIPVDGKYTCPDCFDKELKAGTTEDYRHKHILYDGIALGLAVLPLLPPFVLFGSYYLTIATAPAAIMVSLLYWRKTDSVVPRSKVRYVWALFISIAALIAWLSVIGFLFDKILNKVRL